MALKKNRKEVPPQYKTPKRDFFKSREPFSAKYLGRWKSTSPYLIFLPKAGFFKSALYDKVIYDHIGAWVE
jgi:hypothetical protein